jgi:glutamine synthetase
MSKLRFHALQEVMNRRPKELDISGVVLSNEFGKNVFNDVSMKEFLSDEAYKSVREARMSGTTIDRKMADQVSSAMKAWALSKGATHFTHWFQPLTGRTAEKHDAFFEPLEDGRAIEKFDGSELVQQEPDASSFPSGGLRNTFEARGYTAWDPTSPAFIYGDTLCIPTIFVSYTGHALDFKAPLMKAAAALDKAATDVCQYFDRNVTSVNTTLGWEQEYFLVDSAFFKSRPDLLLSGRTVFGQASSKGQQLDDHYFGSIPERAFNFMREFEIEALRLGIPVTTRHNEVAPNQFEVAPVFEELNLAVDHNQLVMDVMEKVARKHDLHVLLHEKPFAGMNGSGKHNNFSMATNTGSNLLGPGKTPKTNLRFLTFFVNTIKAVHEYADLLRASIASAGNDHRLGANEAPPAIISIFIGSQLTAILDEVEKAVNQGKMSPDEKTDLKLKIGRIPEILLDNTDRNRTSPFAFTGNKFEFRAVGSSANCSQAMTVLSTIVAKQLKEFKKEVDGLIKKDKLQKDEAIFKVLKDYIVSSKAIRFEGNGYSDEWVKESEKRGLKNIKTTPHALDAYIDKKAKKLFSEFKILTAEEIDARQVEDPD